MANEVDRLVSKAVNCWQQGAEQGSISLLQDAVAFFIQAEKVVDQPAPRLKSLLAMVYYDLVLVWSKINDKQAIKKLAENQAAAKSAAEISLQMSPLEFRAQMILTYLAADEVLSLNADLGDLAPSNLGVTGIFGAIAKTVNLGVDIGRVNASKQKFRTEMTKLLDIFRRNFAEYVVPIEEYCYYAERLLTVSGYCQSTGTYPVRDIYQAVLGVNVDELDTEGFTTDEVNEMKAAAVELQDLARVRLGALPG